MADLGPVLQLSSMAPEVRFGGAERVIGWVAAELERAGLTVHNAGLGRPGHSGSPGSVPIRNLYWPFDATRRNVALRTAWHAIDTFGLTARRDVERLVDALQPSVMVTHNLRGWGYAPWVVARSREIPLVHVVHDYGLICTSSTLWHGGPCEQLSGTCRIRRDATQRRWPGGDVVGVSRDVLDRHLHHGVSFMADATVAHPTPAAGQVSRRPRRSTDTDAVPSTVGYLGRISEAKGLDLLLGAVRTSHQRLLVAGTGERSYLRSLRESAGDNVTWLDWVDPDDVLARVDVLVVPSRWHEPFGLVVVEAARAGVPVLIADQPGLVEAAVVSGATFLTFGSNDEAALRSALGQPISSYRSGPSADDPAELVRVIIRAVTRAEAPA